MKNQSESNSTVSEPIVIKRIRSLARQWRQRPYLSHYVLRAAQNAPAMLADHFERWVNQSKK